MRRLDDWLIDRVFQRAAEALERWTNCYAIAAFVFTGGLAAIGCSAALNPFMILVVLVAAPPWIKWIRRAHALADAAPANVLPPERAAHLPYRVQYVVMSGFFVLDDICGFHAYGTVRVVAIVLADAAFPLVAVGLYFLACRRRPPRRATAPAPDIFARAAA